ncbi:MAG: heme o synthase [Waddliaceae bacterium]
MQQRSLPAFTFATKTYCLLTKPGIILGNIITMSGGFALASKGNIDVGLFLATLAGLALVIASGCVFNNYIDRDFDEKMARTKHRALVMGLVSTRQAMVFAIVLGVFGALFLALFTNLLTVMIALLGFFVYVVLYSISKYRSIHGTLVGSIAGAVPPVVGYCAVSNCLDAGALIVFTMIVMWQMPHFFAIAIYRLEDYLAASIPVLPIKKGIHRTKIHMMAYILAFMIASFLLTVFNYTGYTYLVIAALLGIAWLCLCVQGLNCDNHQHWARNMFLFSLVIVVVQCLIIPFNVVA